MREADPGGLETWQRQAADLLRQGYPPDFARRAVDDSLRSSDEYQVLSTVQGAFQDVLGRTPNARGFWHAAAVVAGRGRLHRGPPRAAGDGVPQQR